MLSEAERHVMAHAVGDGAVRSGRYRNVFVAREGHRDWATLQALCARGLMRVSRGPGGFHGDATCFAVTEEGYKALDEVSR